MPKAIVGVKIANETKMLLGLVAAILLLGVTLDYFGYNLISNSTRMIVQLFALGILLFEAKDVPRKMSKQSAQIFKAFVLLTFAALLLVTVFPLFGMTLIPVAWTGLITAFGALVAVILMFI